MTLKILAHNVFKFHLLRRPNHIMFRLESGINFSGAAHGITLYINFVQFSQMFLLVKLKSSFRTLYGRNHDLVDRYLSP
jgi:hypothetical protein